MKKLVFLLFGLCCAAVAVQAQEVAPSDTVTGEPVQAVEAVQPQVEPEQPAKEPKEFKGRRKYFNIGYAWEKLEAVDFPSEEESEWAAFITWGRTFYLHKKPIANMLKIGLDLTWTDMTIASYEVDQLVEETTDFMGMTLPVYSQREASMYRMDYGVHLGPSVTVNPVSALCVNAYFRYAPTFAMSMTKSGDSWDMGYGYASLFVTGAAVSYKAISVGCEYRFGSTKMNVISMDPDNMQFDNIEDISGIGGVGDVLGEIFSTAEKTKYKLKDLRLYISFRF